MIFVYLTVEGVEYLATLQTWSEGSVDEMASTLVVRYEGSNNSTFIIEACLL